MESYWRCIMPCSVPPGTWGIAAFSWIHSPAAAPSYLYTCAYKVLGIGIRVEQAPPTARMMKYKPEEEVYVRIHPITLPTLETDQRNPSATMDESESSCRLSRTTPGMRN